MDKGKSIELFARANEVMPGGVSSPVRAFQSVGGTPFFVEAAHGADLYGVDGERYIDYVQSWGASILGHAFPEVVEAIRAAASRGTTYGAPTEGEVLLAEQITSAVSGVDMVRFVSSGTEAAMTALRLARGLTGRDRIVKFAGCYHGHSDALLAASGSGVATLGLPDSHGVASSAVADTVVVPYNVVPELDERVACVIVEPVAANMGLVAPNPGFLEGLRAACDAVGALLIFDEVITGFRLGRGSITERVKVVADIYCFGKIIGGGLPLAAVGGPKARMEALAPVGSVYQAGTLSGNPVATAAGLATLEQLLPVRYDELEATVDHLVGGLREAFSHYEIPVRIPRFGTLFGIFFSDEDVTDYEASRRAAANGRYRIYFQSMLQDGVFVAPSPYEVAFCSMAHDDAVIEATIDAARNAAKAIASEQS